MLKLEVSFIVFLVFLSVLFVLVCLYYGFAMHRIAKEKQLKRQLVKDLKNKEQVAEEYEEA